MLYDITLFGVLGSRDSVIILTDNDKLETARLIQSESAPFVKRIDVINLDDAVDYSLIYALEPADLLVLHIGIESWMGRHRYIARAFDKPEGIASKYICIRPTITARALLEGLDTPLEVADSVIAKYTSLNDDTPIRVMSKAGTDITLTPYSPWAIPYITNAPGSNAYLPPAEVSYSVRQGSACGIIIADVTVGELRVNNDLVDNFGLVDAPVTLMIENGDIVEITGGAIARKLRRELWKLPAACRKLVEFGVGLSVMTPTGVIGIDESIAGTCHFGFGSGSGNDAPIHLDVVVSAFSVR